MFAACECITLPFPACPGDVHPCGPVSHAARPRRGVAWRGLVGAAAWRSVAGFVHSFISWNAKCASLSAQSNGMQLDLPPRPAPAAQLANIYYLHEQEEP